MRTRLLGYFTTYRWELWLIIGIPVVSIAVQMLVLSTPLIEIFFSDLLRSLSIDKVSQVYVNIWALVAGTVRLLLLSVFYLRVRRLERELLASLWGYSIAIAVIGVATAIAVIVAAVAVADPEESWVVSGLRAAGIQLFALLPQYLALLWFARRLSRVSLTHAFFLVAFTSLYLVIPIQGSIVSGTPWAVDLFIWAPHIWIPIYILAPQVLWLIVGLIKVWLLGSFDRRGDRFRKEAIIILAVTVILSDYADVGIGELLGYLEGPYLTVVPWLGLIIGVVYFVVGFAANLATLLMLFGVVYLIRVRRPKPPDTAPVPANNC